MAKRNRPSEEKSVSEGLAPADVEAEVGMAFGQGAGMLSITPSASQYLTRHFEKQIERHLENWDRKRLGTLAYARGLGWIAATLAMKDGRVDIDIGDLRVAFSLFPCPLFLLDEEPRAEE